MGPRFYISYRRISITLESGILYVRKKNPLTLISLTKNLVYKNMEAKMRKKIRTLLALKPEEFKNI